MQLRSTIKTLATVAATVFITPFLQTPASKLAEKIGFDKILSDNWGPTMSWLSDTATTLSQNPIYIFVAGVLCATAITLWLDVKFKSNETVIITPIPSPSGSAGDPASFGQLCENDLVSIARLCEGKTQIHAEALVQPFVGRERDRFWNGR